MMMKTLSHDHMAKQGAEMGFKPSLAGLESNPGSSLQTEEEAG